MAGNEPDPRRPNFRHPLKARFPDGVGSPAISGCDGASDCLLKAKPMNLPFLYRPALLAIAAALVLTGCDEKRSGAAQAAPSAKPPEVTVVTLAPERIAITTELPGRTSPYRIADVRPQVGVLILQRLLTQGGEVKPA